MLDEEERAQEERAEAEGEDDHQRLVRRAVEVGEALAVEVGEAPGEEPAQAPHEHHRAQPQGGEGQAHAGGKGEPEGEAPGLDHGQGHEARGEGQRGGVPGEVAAGRLVALVVAAQDGERGDAAHGEQRQQREDHGHPEPDSDAAENGGPGDGPGHVHRHDVLQDAGKRHLDRGAEHGPGEAAEKAHRHRLHEVGGEDRASGRAQAAENGDRGHPPLDEHVHGARDPEAAEEEGHERDEAEEVAEAGERVGETPLVVGDRADVQALGREPGAEAVGQLLGVGPRGQAQVGLVAGARAAGQEPGLLDARTGDEEARAEGAAHAHVARHVLDRGPQHEARLAEGDLVTDRRAQGDEQRGVGDRAARLGESGPLAGGRRLDRAVERVAGVHGQHLGQPRRLAPRLEDHGPEVHHARHVGGGARRPAQLAEERFGGLREGRGGGKSEVGAEQCPGLALDGPSQVVREGVDGDEGADADRHREDDEQPPARLGPRLAPGEATG